MQPEQIEVLRVEIAKLELKPSDWLVLKVKDDLTQHETACLSEQAKAILNHDRVMVLSGDVDLTVVKDIPANPIPNYHRVVGSGLSV